MTSLPTAATWTPPQLAPSLSAEACLAGQLDGQLEDEQFLRQAFRSFAEAAGSLERSYGMLRAEVERLRRELEETNADLSASLEQNCAMRAHLDRILEGLPSGVLVISPAGEVTRANPEARRLLGGFLSGQIMSGEVIPSEVMSGEIMPGGITSSRIASSRITVSGINGDAPALDSTCLPAVLREWIERAGEDRAHGWQAGEEREFSIAGEDGCSRWLLARCAWISDGPEPCCLVILTDITERKRLESAQAKLRREQALAEMSAILAHEIRNPLASLELFAGLLAESDLEDEQLQWVEHVQAGLRTLAATVNNVLHFHSLPEPQRAPLDLGQLLDWARDFFAPLARQSHIALSAQNRLRGVWFDADRHRLEQVLLNLVLNAVRAMPEGGWIEIGGYVTPDGRSILIRVADTGPGIAREDLPKIFDAGFSTRAQSSGLGLAVCRKIVEQHGGTIHAESPPERGATFTLTFPIDAGVPRHDTQAAHRGDVSCGPNCDPGCDPRGVERSVQRVVQRSIQRVVQRGDQP